MVQFVDPIIPASDENADSLNGESQDTTFYWPLLDIEGETEDRADDDWRGPAYDDGPQHLPFGWKVTFGYGEDEGSMGVHTGTDFFASAPGYKMELDAEGNLVPMLDENGEKIPRMDNGKIAYTDAAFGSPIVAIADGTVVYSGPYYKDRNLDGTISPEEVSEGVADVVVIRHEIVTNGETEIVYSRYLHVDSDESIQVGDTVKGGQQIATVGDFGDKGEHGLDHLHFDIIKETPKEYGIYFDPENPVESGLAIALNWPGIKTKLAYSDSGVMWYQGTDGSLPDGATPLSKLDENGKPIPGDMTAEEFVHLFYYDPIEFLNSRGAVTYTKEIAAALEQDALQQNPPEGTIPEPQDKPSEPSQKDDAAQVEEHSKSFGKVQAQSSVGKAQHQPETALDLLEDYLQFCEEKASDILGYAASLFEDIITPSPPSSGGEIGSKSQQRR